MNKGGRPTLPPDQKQGKPIPVGLKPYQQDMLKLIKSKMREKFVSNKLEFNMVDADILRLSLEEYYKKFQDD